MYLTAEFLDRYKNIHPPFGGSGLGAFVYLRTYSRFLENRQRRETWLETVQRVVEYSMSLYQGPATFESLKEEAEVLFDSIFNLRLFPSGRTLWVGGTEAAKKFPIANFNCAFTIINSFESITDTFYLLLCGSGVGFRILEKDIHNLPAINNKIVLANKPYHPKNKEDRIEQTQIYEGDGSVYIIVGDSKLAWVSALQYYFDSIQREDIEAIIINYDSVRPAGELLKTFGGRASGHTALRNMFTNIHNIIRRGKNKLNSLQTLDILNYIGENVVVGGTRRTSQIALFDQTDEKVLNAKVGLFDSTHENYGKSNRFMSNNSIFFTKKPSREELLSIFEKINVSSEPGFINYEAMQLRRPNADGLNPLIA